MPTTVPTSSIATRTAAATTSSVSRRLRPLGFELCSWDAVLKGRNARRSPERSTSAFSRCTLPAPAAGDAGCCRGAAATSMRPDRDRRLLARGRVALSTPEAGEAPGPPIGRVPAVGGLRVAGCGLRQGRKLATTDGQLEQVGLSHAVAVHGKGRRRWKPA